MFRYCMLLLMILLVSCGVFRKQNQEMVIPEGLDEAISSAARADENTERDEYQHPEETLEFFGLKPQMTVVEVSPGGGYFAEILSAYLAKEGQYVMALPRLPRNPPRILIENEKKLQDILLRHPTVQAKTKIIPFEPVDKRNKTKTAFADLVLSFNGVHNWVAKSFANNAFKFFYDILKPGGTLGIVQHRVRQGRRKIPKSGYLYESEVISLAQAAGFKFVGKSEVNANPKDLADYPEGVWVLPPTYRLGDKNRSKFEDIGESDRMTLKFVK